MIENQINIEAARFIRESIPSVAIFEIGNDFTGKISATSMNFKKLADSHEFYAFTRSREEKRFLVKRKSAIQVDLPQSVITPNVYGVIDGYQILELPTDSIFPDFYNSHNLACNEDNQMAFRILEWKQQLINMNHSLLIKLKENYGKDSKLEDFLTSSRSQSCLIFLG